MNERHNIPVPGAPDEVAVIEADVELPPQAVVQRGGTFESFRYPDFTWFWAGSLVSNVGTWMQAYALGIVVFALRRSEFDLGLINFISGIPVLLLALLGGAIADKVERRKLLIAIQVVLMFEASSLGLLYHSGRLSSGDPRFALAAIATLGTIAGVSSAIQFPAWQAMLPDLVPRESLLNGIALNAAQFQSSRLIGPLVAGALVVAGAGMGEIFFVNAASFLFVIAALWFMRPQFAAPATGAHGRGGTGGPSSSDEAGSAGRSRLLDGLHYVRTQNRATGVLIASTAVMTVFGFAYMTLLPAIVDKVLGLSEGGDPYNRAIAVIMATNGLGAMVGALGVASLPRHVRHERIVPYALATFGASILAFSLSRDLWLTAAFSAVAGGALMTTNSMANTAIQASAPPHLRGRVMALFVMAFMGMMPISGLAFGVLGQRVGPAGAVLAGSVVVIVWSAVLITRPGWLAMREVDGVGAGATGGGAHGPRA